MAFHTPCRGSTHPLATLRGKLILPLCVMLYSRLMELGIHVINTANAKTKLVRRYAILTGSSRLSLSDARDRMPWNFSSTVARCCRR